MRMREWCLVNDTGHVVTIAMTSNPDGPADVPHVYATGEYYWVPVEAVSDTKLSRYEFWNVRP